MKLSDITAEWCIARTLGVEAGYVNDPKDSGGETCCGVTKAVALENAALLKSMGWDGDIRHITPKMATALFKVKYWDKVRGDDLIKVHPLIAQRLFDFGVNAGTGSAGLYIQQVLNVLNREGKDYADIAEDGGIGNGTITALKAFAAKNGPKGVLYFLTTICGEHSHHYVSISQKNSKNERFTNGWEIRLFEDYTLYAKLLLGVA